MSPGERIGRLPGIAVSFLRLGLIAFGGPAAHLALLEDEFVTRRGWISRQRFLDLMGATSLIPGPNSTEMTMHLGYERAGAAGLFTAGFGFVAPASLITGVLAWGYVEFGQLPEVEPVMAGFRPAVLVVILGAVWKLGRKAITDWKMALIGTCVAVAVWAGIGEVAAILLGGVVGAACLQLPRVMRSVIGVLSLVAMSARSLEAAESADLGKLGLFFLKVGAVLYGSGYVLVAFLEGGLVDGYGWVTRQELLDAIAVGQFTPGPVLTTATFLGFLVAGPAGAAVATVGIFLPAFGFVWILNPLVRRLRQSPVTSAFLDAVNASAVGLMAVVAVDLSRATLVSWPVWTIAGCAAVALFGARLAAVWIVLGGGILGWVAMALGWL